MLEGLKGVKKFTHLAIIGTENDLPIFFQVIDWKLLLLLHILEVLSVLYLYISVSTEKNNACQSSCSLAKCVKKFTPRFHPLDGWFCPSPLGHF